MLLQIKIRRFLPKYEIKERLEELAAKNQEAAVHMVAEMTGKQIEGATIRRQSLAHQVGHFYVNTV